MNYKSSVPVPGFKPDGLTITATEPWFKVKVQLLHTYIQAFITHAITKADEIVLIDLFAGSGLYSFGHQKEVFPGTCLMTLDDALPVSKYIFCEHEAERAHALRERTRYFSKTKRIEVIDKPVAECMDYFRTQVQKIKGRRTTAICLVDPFSIEIPFSLITSLASSGFNLLVPFTFILNDRLNYNYYLIYQQEKVKRFLGISDLDRLKACSNNARFYKRLVQIYQNNMLATGMNTALSMHKVDSQLMQIPAYYVGFFSKQFSTQAISREVKSGEQLQFELF